MYSMFEKLCEERGVTPYRVAKDTGITTATLSNWKKGRYVPKADKLQRIADYFGVPLRYLMTGEKPPVIHYDEKETDAFNDEMKLLIETVEYCDPDTLRRLRYYAEGLIAGRKDKT